MRKFIVFACLTLITLVALACLDIRSNTCTHNDPMRDNPIYENLLDQKGWEDWDENQCFTCNAWAARARGRLMGEKGSYVKDWVWHDLEQDNNGNTFDKVIGEVPERFRGLIKNNSNQ